MANAGVPAPELVTSEAPQSHIDASAFARPQQVGIASGLEQLGAGLEDVADTAAKDQAASDVQKAVTRDAGGNLVVATPSNSVILGRAGQDYHEVMVAGLRAQLTSNVSNDIAAVRAKFPTNPQAFAAGAGAVADHYREAYPGQIGNALSAQAQNEGSQYHAGIVEAGITRDTHEALQAITTQIDDGNSKLRVLARQGAIDTSEFQQLQQQVNANYDALGSRPMFGFSQAKIDSEKAHSASMLNGEFVVGRIDDTFTKKGKAAALEAVKNGIDNNTALNLSEPERNQLHSYAMSRLSYLSAENVAQIAALKPGVALQVKALTSGNAGADAVSDREYEQTHQQLLSLGAFTEAQELSAAKVLADRMAPFRNLLPEQRTAAVLGSGQPGATGGPAAAAPAGGGYIATLIGHEAGSQGMAAFNPATGATGIGQFLPSTWAGLVKSRPDLNLTPDGIHDLAQQQRALVAFTNDNRAFLQKNGIEPTDRNTFMAHFLGSGGATTFIKAMQANPGGSALDTVGFKVATANPTIFYKPGASGKPDPTQPRSLSEVYALQTQRFSGATTPVVAVAGGGGQGGQPFTDEEAAANPWLRTLYRQQMQVDAATQVKFAKSQFQVMEQSIKFAGAPTPEMMGPAATVLQIADAHPDQLGDEAAKLRGAMKGQQVGFVAAGTPDGGADMLARVDGMVRDAPGNLFALSLGKGVRDGEARGKKLLADDPHEYARQSEWIGAKPPAMDFSSAQGVAGIPQALNARVAAAAAISSHTGRPQLAFSPADLRTFGSGMAAATPDAVSQTLAGVNTMPGPTLDALMGNEQFKGALNGLMRSGDPAKMNSAFSFLDAQYRRNPVMFDANDDGALKQMRVWQTLSQYLPPDEVTKRILQADDPNQVKARDAMGKQADEQLKGLDGGSVVRNLYAAKVPLLGSNIPFTAPGDEASDRSAVAAGNMLYDYRALYKDFYADTGDAKAANAYAMEKLGNKYSVSALNGGRVMAFAPDRENADGTGAFYPKVNGSFDWLHQQLAHDVQQTPYFSDLRHADYSAAVNIARTGSGILLMPDATTQADIAAKRPPSYTVLAQGNDGRLHAIQGDGGRPFRFFGDPTAAQHALVDSLPARRMEDARIDSTASSGAGAY